MKLLVASQSKHDTIILPDKVSQIVFLKQVNNFMPFRTKSESLEVQPLQFMESHAKYTSKDRHFRSVLFQTLSVCI